MATMVVVSSEELLIFAPAKTKVPKAEIHLDILLIFWEAIMISVMTGRMVLRCFNDVWGREEEAMT